MSKLNLTLFLSSFRKAIEALKGGENSTYYWYLSRNNNGYNYAIVVGWSEGFDDEEDACCKSGYRICAKLARNKPESVCMSDFDMDWEIPYDEQTGEVNDTCTPIYADETYDDFKETAKYLLRNYVANYGSED